MENYKIPPIFKYYREVVGKDKIRLAIVNDDDELNFVDKDQDIVLLRSANKNIVNCIKDKRLISTAEDFSIYKIVRDKKNIGKLFVESKIQVPRQFNVAEIEEGKKYFVKPRFGSESFGITRDCLCSSKDEVRTQVKRIERECNQEALIEEFIEGIDCTCACAWNTEGELETYAIKVENDEIGGIQTHEGKFNYDEYCSALTGHEKEELYDITRKVVKLLGIKHHARIDFRMTENGDFYLIDVNLLPGLGPTAHFAKCMLLDGDKSYKTAIWTIIKSSLAENKNQQIQI